MAYYTALINAWNSAIQPPTGVNGTGLNAGMTTAQKLAAVNGWTITGTTPTLAFATGNQIFNCIVWSEFEAITASQQTLLLQVCTLPGNLLGGSASPFIAPFFGTIAAKMPNTISALVALSQALVTPWWQENGYPAPFNENDLIAAGGLT